MVWMVWKILSQMQHTQSSDNSCTSQLYITSAKYGQLKPKYATSDKQKVHIIKYTWQCNTAYMKCVQTRDRSEHNQEVIKYNFRKLLSKLSSSLKSTWVVSWSKFAMFAGFLFYTFYHLLYKYFSGLNCIPENYAYPFEQDLPLLGYLRITMNLLGENG